MRLIPACAITSMALFASSMAADTDYCPDRCQRFADVSPLIPVSQGLATEARIREYLWSHWIREETACMCAKFSSVDATSHNAIYIERGPDRKLRINVIADTWSGILWPGDEDRRPKDWGRGFKSLMFTGMRRDPIVRDGDPDDGRNYVLVLVGGPKGSEREY